MNNYDSNSNWNMKITHFLNQDKNLKLTRKVTNS
jgi:hypothetical protein